VQVRLRKVDKAEQAEPGLGVQSKAGQVNGKLLP
jgi:hypothetical protein